MRAIATLIDRTNLTIGRTLYWLTLGVVLVQFFVVLMRYVFGVGSIWFQESIIYMHATLFMLAAAYTLAKDGHVRVDIFYREADPRRKAMVNLFGAVFFLIPMALVVFLFSRDYVWRSWMILEGSRETSGIPGVFLLKTCILIFAVQMALQGVSMALRSILALRGDIPELEALSAHGREH